MKIAFGRALACLGICLVAGLPMPGAHAKPGSIAIVDANIVDVVSGEVLTQRTVVIEGQRITAVGAAHSLKVPAGSVQVDGRGLYLIPGLWDMHVHATQPGWGRQFYPLLLANGITGIRDTWGSGEHAGVLEKQVNSGALAGPVRVYATSHLVDGAPAIWPGSDVATTPEEGRRLVDAIADQGDPYVKVYSRLSPQVYSAIATRARQRGIDFIGHVPQGVRAADAAKAGQRSMEHLYGIGKGCSLEEDALISESLAADAARIAKDNARRAEIVQRGTNRMLSTQDEQRCQSLMRLLIENQTWQVPTLVTLRGYAFLQELAERGDERLRYLRKPVYQSWFPAKNSFTQGEPEGARQARQRGYELSRSLVGRMSAMGVPLLAGSDTPNPWAFPGFGLHDELELLVESGLSPVQALRAATLDPARYFGRTRELGSVATGKLADLVLLEANPLETIGNTRRIRAVVADGRLYTRKDLDGLLASAQADAAQAQLPPD